MKNTVWDKVEKLLRFESGALTPGSIMYFHGLTPANARKLIELGVMNPEGTQNDSPTALEFITWLEQPGHEKYTMYGYVVLPPREDTRVSIEGIETQGAVRLSITDIIEFTEAFRSADEFEISEAHARVWWD